MLLQIRGCQLPGRTWRSRDEHHDNVHVGIQVGKQPRELVPTDAETSSWTIPIEVVAREAGLDLRGTAVHGGRGARGCGRPHCASRGPSTDATVNRFRREPVPADYADTPTPPRGRAARTAMDGRRPC
jgi:hypothetical protein